MSIEFREWYLRLGEKREFSIENDIRFMKHCEALKDLAGKLRDMEWHPREIREELYSHCWYK